MFTNRISKFFAGLLALAVFLATASFVSRSATASTADRSYDGIEQSRLLRPLAYSSSAFGYDQIEALRLGRNPGVDASYNAVEQLRLNRGLSADHSYDQIEALRIQNSAGAVTIVSGYDLVEQLRLGRHTSADHSYDAIEALRIQR